MALGSSSQKEHMPLTLRNLWEWDKPEVTHHQILATTQPVAPGMGGNRSSGAKAGTWEAGEAGGAWGITIRLS